MSAPFEGALREAARLLAALAVPILLAALAAGLVTGLLQAIAEVRDRSISVVPRILAVGAVLALLGGWMAEQLSGFTRTMLSSAQAAGAPAPAAAPPAPPAP